MPAQGRSGQFHRKPGTVRCGARSSGLPGRKNAGDEPGRSKRRSRASWAGWRASSGPKRRTSRPKQSCRNTTSTIMRAFWRCSKRTARNWTIDPARRETALGAPGRVRGRLGNLLPLRERTLEDGRADRLWPGCTLLRKMRSGLWKEATASKSFISFYRPYHDGIDL